MEAAVWGALAVVIAAILSLIGQIRLTRQNTKIATQTARVDEQRVELTDQQLLIDQLQEERNGLRIRLDGLVAANDELHEKVRECELRDHERHLKLIGAENQIQQLMLRGQTQGHEIILLREEIAELKHHVELSRVVQKDLVSDETVHRVAGRIADKVIEKGNEQGGT